MTKEADWRAIAHEEMRFFGDVSAAISHEINNRLAVISEKAGLVEDLATMALKGKEVDPGRFAEQGRKILEQVQMARDIVRNLNRFAHSVELERSTVEVIELLQFVADLYARKAAMAGTTLSVDTASQPVTVTTCPFVLETLVGRGIDLALAHCSGTAGVTMNADSSDGAVTVAFVGLTGVTDPVAAAESAQSVPALLAWIGARFSCDADGTTLRLEIPNHERLIQGRTA